MAFAPIKVSKNLNLLIPNKMILLAVERKIKLLEWVSYMCAIIPACFMKLPMIIAFGLIGLILQVPLYLHYKLLNCEIEYLKNKAGALIVGCLLVGYLIIKHQILN
jgi:hypothetical protein